MADIKKAFEILIEADSRSAENSFNSLAETQDKTISATEQLNKIILTLNSTFELQKTALENQSKEQKKLAEEDRAAAKAKQLLADDTMEAKRAIDQLTSGFPVATKETKALSKETDTLTKLFPSLVGAADSASKTMKQSFTDVGIDILSTNLFSLKDAAEFAAKSIAGIAASAAGAGAAIVGLAAAGGEFAESRQQFENLARTAGQSSEQIVKDLKEISGNTITIKQSFELAGSALVSGLSGEQIKTAFAFAKKASEAGKGDFESLSATIVEAMAKGRYATLKGFGVMIEEGAKMGDAFKVLEESTKRFGDVGFNTSDVLTSLGVSFIDLKDSIGEAINAAPEFQAIFTGLDEAARGFVDQLDFDAIRNFTSKGVVAFQGLFESIVDDLSGVGRSFQSFFDIDVRQEKFFTSFVDAFFTIKGSFATAFNGIVETTKNVVGTFDFAFSTIAKGIVEIPLLITRAAYKANTIIGETLLDIISAFESAIGKLPKKAQELFGFGDAGLLASAKNDIKALITESVEGSKANAKLNQDFVDAYIAGIDEQAAANQKFFDDMKIDIEGIVEEQDTLLSKIKSVGNETTEQTASWYGPLKGAVLGFASAAEDAYSEIADAAKEAYKSQEKASKDTATKEKKDILEVEKAAKESAKRREEIQKQLTSALDLESEKRLTREQEDQRIALKNQQELDAILNRSIGRAGIRTSDLIEQEVIKQRQAQEQEALSLSRRQEDELSAFRQKQLEQKLTEIEDTSGAEKQIKALTDRLAKLPTALRDALKTGTGEAVPLKIELVNAGSLSDTLLNIIFREAQLRAISEGVRVVAP